MSAGFPLAAGSVNEFSFSRQNRLLHPSLFKAVFDTPDHRVGSGVFLVLARHNPSGPGRLGMVIGKKRIKHASARNVVKRQIRESFRLRQGQLAELDIVVLVRASLPDPVAAEVRAELEKLWDKLLAKRQQA